MGTRMKIALICTHGVGKTTVCYDLAARAKRLDLSVGLVTEVARECPLPINRNTTLDAQTWILHTQCAREVQAASDADLVICDRSVLDNYAYLVHAVGRREDLDAWIRQWCGSYAGLFKVPLWQRPRFDGTRDTDVSFQREIDAALDRLRKELGVKVHELPGTEPDEWAPHILNVLELPRQPRQQQLFGDDEP